MFTIAQIKAAHATVKTGADFPNYIKVLKALGIQQYQTFVSDSHTDYAGANGYSISSEPVYDPLTISATANKTAFESELKKHQGGGSGYMEFCEQCAANGINKWIVDLEKMTCTYYDSNGAAVYMEPVPEV